MCCSSYRKYETIKTLENGVKIVKVDGKEAISLSVGDQVIGPKIPQKYSPFYFPVVGRCGPTGKKSNGLGE